MKKIFILTGEPSGDKLASKVISQLKNSRPDIEYLSVGGEHLKSLGIKSLYDLKEVTYLGFTKVLLNIFQIKSKINQTVKEILKFKPDILFSVDSPDFTLRVAKEVKKNDPSIKTVHFVAPQVWVWREHRVKKLKSFLDHILLLFPFEKKYFEKENIQSTFTGHPLLENEEKTKIVFYDYDNNWSWFAGAYKGFSFTSPSGAVDDGTPLQPEKSVQKELGFRYNNNSLFTQLTAFHVNYDNLLVIDNSNSGNSADNAGEVVTQGIEFSSVYSSRDLMPKGDISFFFNGTYTDAYLPSNTKSTDAESIFAGGTKGAMMPYIPEYDFALGADYTIDKFTLGLEGSYTPEMFTSALNTESEQNSSGTADARHGKTDDHFLLNINLAYKLSDMFGISAGVKNALDLEYISSRHPGGARSGAPISAWVKAKATY